MGVHRRRRVVHQPVAHQGRGPDMARHVLAGLEGNGRQGAQGMHLVMAEHRRIPTRRLRAAPSGPHACPDPSSAASPFDTGEAAAAIETSGSAAETAAVAALTSDSSVPRPSVKVTLTLTVLPASAAVNV